MNALPVIDVSPLAGGDAAARRAVAADLGRACREVGFFYASGHGLPAALFERAFGAARAFFALPDEDKAAVAIERSPHNRGYVRLGGESLDPSKPADLKEAFNIGIDLAADDPDVVAGVPFRGVNLWPVLPDFREATTAYFDAVLALGRRLHTAIALDLGVPENFFADKLDRPMATLRLLRYPPAPEKMAEGQRGAGTHTDYGNLTLLATDGTAGLEVQGRDGRWIDAPHIDGAFVCNIGDCLTRWTNDVYVSTPHRVRPPARERLSIAFFLDPNPDAVVAALPSCVGPDRPARYPPTTGAAYLAERLDATYTFRRRA